MVLNAASMTRYSTQARSTIWRSGKNRWAFLPSIEGWELLQAQLG